jgi:hypothetical protein
MNERVIFVKSQEGPYYTPKKIDVDRLVCNECDKLIANDPARGYENPDKQIILVHEYCGENLSEPLSFERIHSDSRLKSVHAQQ